MQLALRGGRIIPNNRKRVRIPVDDAVIQVNPRELHVSSNQVLEALPTLIERLEQKYPNARYELDWETPLQLLVATILAAQCTDERVNQVTPALFARYKDAEAYASADQEELEGLIRGTGFYHEKALKIQGACRGLVESFGGEVPRTMEEMITLPGVARKTANVVLNNAFRIPSGIIVDTHVARVSQRLGLSKQKKPEKIELDLMKVVPKDRWITFGPALVLLGRYTCTHHAPKCSECILADLCPKIGVEEADSEEPEETAEAETPAPVSTPTSALAAQLPADWREVLAEEFTKPYWQELEAFVNREREEHTVFPPAEDVFNAFKYTPFDRVKVLLLGQDPYHDDGQAHGLAFSVRPGVRPPPSLVNMFKELHADLGCKIPNNGYLVPWAERGVMLLNAVLTVRAHQANSHKDHGWEQFTDAVIRALNRRGRSVVFALWGGYAQKKTALIDGSHQRILTAAHPSPLSMKKFMGSRPFSAINAALEELGESPINWQLPDLAPNSAADETEEPSRSHRPAPTSVEETPMASRSTARSSKSKAAEPARKGKASTRKATAKKTAPTAATASATSTEKKPAPAPKPAAPAPQPTLHRLLPADWQAALADEIKKPAFLRLEQFLAAERQASTVYPTEEDLFAAFRLTPYEQVRVVMLGQEPYADGHGDGLAYSVRTGLRPSAMLSTIFKELWNDLGCTISRGNGSLVPWAKQGVLLLNNVLTVRRQTPGSHEDKGWEDFTDGVIRAVNALAHPVAFLLLGDEAQSKARIIDEKRHIVIRAEHPSVGNDFIGSGVFSQVNNALELRGQSAIYWQIFDV